MTWIEQEHGWVAASEEIVMALGTLNLPFSVLADGHAERDFPFALVE